MRRIRDRNKDLIGRCGCNADVRTISVFRSYLDSRIANWRHGRHDRARFRHDVEDSHVETRLIEYRQARPRTAINGRGTGELIAVALTDVSVTDSRWSILSSRKAKHPVRSAPS